ncbi:preprotein translocase subunit YajC [Lacticaseibacillus thailandensis]|uniref:Preprotein translocase subunit YajC n=1 Tax=Lacticaseibacillus thailandensis DSM 22698 = JCM 13996 TaxID=1423810 RepID=A0A0R2CEM0_9LACO|nr:preprotein translocase subunit YajC [Lacticaseibacillus thailandensis]KRM86827.1 hypothetical protein FD19_GL001685 [Lacticaseibacillus thailandensis DSM 22698 = JCM 13996]
MIFGASTGMGPVTIILIILMVVLMYFSMVRGPKKQQQQRQQMFNGLKKGDSVVTVGGLYGVIDSMDQEHGQIVLDCNGVYLTFATQAISRVEKHADAAKATTPAGADSAAADTADAAVSDAADSSAAASETNDEAK